MNTKNSKRKSQLTSALCGALLAGILTGCGGAAEFDGRGISSADTAPQPAGSVPALCMAADNTETDNGVSYAEGFKRYEPFGLVYDAEKNELRYNGKTVRWFEDYYPIADGMQAGRDFFNENGVVDVYAVREFDSSVRLEDGSFDPGGRLTGLKEASREEFAAWDIESIRNPPPAAALAGEPPTEKELKKMAGEYEAFGVQYDVQNDQWYFNGEKVRFFQDVLFSNGESLTGGGFRGALRKFWSEEGTIDLYTVRDFTCPDADGFGKLTDIKAFTQAEFDERTRSARKSEVSAGFCTVTQDG